MALLSIHDAFIFASHKHSIQLRKGTNIPYITHPMEVMQILTANNCPQDVIVAGILHDTLEDTDTTPQEIKQRFGERVLNIVNGETEDKTKTWRERKQGTINRIKNAPIEMQQVCCADKLANIRSIYADKLQIGDAVFERFSGSKQEVQWYYTSVANALTDLDGYEMKRELVEVIKLVFD